MSDREIIIKLEKSDEIQINPATEDKQDDILDELNNIINVL